MDREQLYNYMKQPEALDSSSIEELQRAVETYPYFQTGRLLYTKGLHLTGDPKYGDELGKAALFCADRSRLFYLIHSERYEELLQQPGRDSMSEKDRTEALLDSYLQSFEEKKNPEPGTSPIEEHIASADYFAYLESQGEEIGASSDQRQRLQHQDIIDAFIENADNLSIRPAPATQWNTPQEEPEAEVENEFLTETLAKIYIKQKKYEQALTIIKQLSLNFPKKSAYFADQIRFLEYLIINEKNKK